jgi:hypothetical protein
VLSEKGKLSTKTKLMSFTAIQPLPTRSLLWGLGRERNDRISGGLEKALWATARQDLTLIHALMEGMYQP